MQTCFINCYRQGDYAKGESGEALTIADKHETWIFHIVPDDSGASSVWVAKRVPKGHVAVVANAFTIQHIDLDDTDNYLASKNIYDVAKRLKLYDSNSNEKFSFAKIYGSRMYYEVYCSRRMWRIYTLVAPSLADKLSSNASVLELPFSVPVDNKLTSDDLFRIQRDHYEGTEYDMTRGLASGPYGNPNRYDRGGDIDMSILMQGTFERAISLFRTSYSFVTNSRSYIEYNDIANRVWFGMAAPHSTFYTLFYPAQYTLPYTHTNGSLYHCDHNTAWWAATAVGNYMERAWSYISVDVYKAQSDYETQLRKQVNDIEDYVIDLYNNNDIHNAIQHLTDFTVSYAIKQTQAWWSLFDYLLTKYHDGYMLTDFHAETIDPYSYFYPLQWLKEAGFFKNGVNKHQTSWQYTTDWVLNPAQDRPHHNQSSSTQDNTAQKQHQQITKQQQQQHNIHHTKPTESEQNIKDADTLLSHRHSQDSKYPIHIPQQHEQQHAHTFDHMLSFSVLAVAIIFFSMGYGAGYYYTKQREYRRINDMHDDINI